MSQVGQTRPPDLSEGPPVAQLTVVVLLLIPCVLLLLLLNCLFLGYKVLVLSKQTRRQVRPDPEQVLLQTRRQVRPDPEQVLLQSPVHRVPRLSDLVFPQQLQDGTRAYMSLSEPVLPHPVTSSRASSRERPGLGPGPGHRIRLLRPDGATGGGSGSLRAPSTIPAASSGFSPRLDLASGSRTYSTSKGEWRKSGPVPPRSSGSETDTRVDIVPPNSPMPEAEDVAHIHRSSTYDMLTDVNPGVVVHLFDKVDTQCGYPDPPSEGSGLNVSTVGPGLDSDFGASAGVSLRILSADSDGLSNGVLSSVLEWDYYDPCYVKQNNVPKYIHHRPAMHMKQYWV
ncbi:protein huluwa [Sphaeramia orbicularis]|uniref:protein huluwa n=1 Tax=Sphaeramia orbicularis TaxID=375764 RepID=UPI00117F07E9|nr:protein huluwa-like [Sphaeramia orbicularis]